MSISKTVGNKKMRLLYVSPFNPKRSGISDYSERLIYALKKYFEIDLLTNGYRLENKKMRRDFSVLNYSTDEVDFHKYTYKIYNIGNNPDNHLFIYKIALENPGWVIMHDLVIFYLVCGYYKDKKMLYKKIFEIEGAEGINKIKWLLKQGSDLLKHKEIAQEIPMNNELINSGNNFLVHSNYTKNKVLDKIKIKTTVVKKINFPSKKTKYRKFPKNEIFERYKIPKNKIVVSSLGFSDYTKMNDVVAEVVNELNTEVRDKLCYLMVGDGNFADKYLGSSIIKTGYVDTDDFNNLTDYSDIIVNLRYPSMGETSAALIHAMEFAKPCMVINDAWFSEISGDAVIKIKHDRHIKQTLKREISRLATNKKQRLILGKNAKRYVESNHDLDKTAQTIFRILSTSSTNKTKKCR